MNIALAVLGGHVEGPTDASDKRWKPSNLIDGYPVIRGTGNVDTSLGWRAIQATFPQELTFSFVENREASVAAVVIDTAAGDSLDNSRGRPKDVEVWVSTATSSDAFTKVATASLAPVANEQLLEFTPARARYVKLVILSTHGKGVPEIGEVQIYEPANVTSIAASLPSNLALPALGGSIVQFTSQLREGMAVELVDGKTNDQAGWCSGPGPLGPANHLPQEITFAFRDQRSAFVDRVVIDPTSGFRFYAGPRPNTKTWVKTVELLGSSTGHTDGFESLGVLTIPSEPKPVSLTVGRAMRYLKLRILENHGATRTTLGEVQVFERAAGGQGSVLSGRSALVASGSAAVASGSEAATRREREPNDTVAQADPLQPGAAVGGTLSTLGDQDIFSLLASSSSARQAVTVDVEGQPVIRTRIGLLDQSGRILHEWDPSQITGAHARFSILADPGDVRLRLMQPPGAQVVIWDTSGSMSGHTRDLETGLRQYFDRVEPTDQVNLIRFDNSAEVLLKTFTNDRAALLGALKGKVFAGGGTAIYDAVAKAVELLQPVRGNRAIILMTDGEDTISRTGLPEFWRLLRDGHIRLYAIGLGAGLRSFVAFSGATADRVLANAALAAGGRFLFASTSAELGAFYQQIADELRRPATYAVSAHASASAGSLEVKEVGEPLTALTAPQQIELVLDASGSMKRRLGAQSMMDIARAVLSSTVRGLPQDAQVALRVYGHRVPEGGPSACRDTQLVVPFGAQNRQRLLAAIAQVKALGTTPIAYTIGVAAADFAKKPGAKMLILVTDGQEECGGDPEAAAAALRAQSLDVTLNIVGFGLTTAKDRDMMSKVAAAAGGRYFAARDGQALDGALRQALAVRYDVVDAAGHVAASGVVGGERVQVPQGVYTVRVQSAGRPIVAEQVEVVANQLSTVALKKEGSEVAVRVVAPVKPGVTR